MSGKFAYFVGDGKVDDAAMAEELLETTVKDDKLLAEQAVRDAIADGMDEDLAKLMYGVQR